VGEFFEPGKMDDTVVIVVEGMTIRNPRATKVRRRYPPIIAAILGRPHQTTTLATVYLAGLLAFAIHYLGPSLFRSWFFSSDEYVFAAEVIRFLHLDFRQHFFDIPGTPFMFLSAAIWSLIYALLAVLGLLAPGTGIEHFTFDHLPALFTTMRTLTLFFFLCSIILLFILAARLTNKAGAAVACLVLLMSPTYTSYSSFVRTESLSVCLILISILCLLRALEGRPRPGNRSHEASLVTLAGTFAGLAAASRLHSIIASLPLLLLLLFRKGEDPPVYPRWLSLCWKYGLLIVFTLGVPILIAIQAVCIERNGTIKRIIQSYPKTFAALYSYLFVAATAIGAGWILHMMSRAKPIMDRLLHPRVFLLMAGCCTGFLVGNPTILWQSKYFLQSQEMYRSAYLDLDRTAWPLLKNILWYTWFYLRVVAPDNLSLLLLCVGVATILIRRDRRLVPFILTAALFFVSKPINLTAAAHHIIPWLPFYGIIMGYPVARVFGMTWGRLPYERALKVGTLTALLGVFGLVMTQGPSNTAKNARWTEERMHNIALATKWIKENTEQDAAVAVSYFCFNQDIFFTWLQVLEVPVPQYALDGRRYIIWWGNRSTLKGLNGYACASTSDLNAIKFKLDLASPGEGTNPYVDKQFRVLKAFGSGDNRVEVFRFDFR
jgi:4-amino-4-deoxy-L-arabinose transferase-like glycosyltransferase